MKTHVMVDIETLGTTPGSVVASIGAASFNSGGILDIMSVAVDLRSALTCGLTVDADTLKFWLTETSDAARKSLFDKSLPLREALHRFTMFFTHEVHGRWLWAHGSCFDIPLLDAAYSAAGYHSFRPYAFRYVRDTRTIYGQLAAIHEGTDWMPSRTGVQHGALDDACYQVTCLLTAHRLLGIKLEGED